MDFKDKLHQLEQAQAYQEWKTSHPQSYLVHFFVMIGKEERQGQSETMMEWQIGFLNTNDTITSFESINDDPQFGIREDEAIFRPDQQNIPEVIISEVHETIESIAATCHELQKKKYPAEIPLKKIMVLQFIHGLGLVVNVTYITLTLKTLNIKINATTGAIVEDGLHDVFSFDKGNKEEQKNL